MVIRFWLEGINSDRFDPQPLNLSGFSARGHFARRAI